MQNLFEEIREYLLNDLDDRIRKGGVEDALIISYYTQRFCGCFRVHSKRLYRALLQARRTGDAAEEAGAKRDFALFLVNSLAHDDRLAGKRGKCDSLEARRALVPFDALWNKDWARLKKKDGGKDVLTEIRVSLEDGDEGLERARSLECDALCNLLVAMLRADARNKNFSASQRLMELEEDMLISDLGEASLEGLSREELAAQHEDDVRAYKGCFDNRSKRASLLRQLFGFDRAKNTCDWWMGVIEHPEKADPELGNLILCSTSVPAVVFLDNLGKGRTTDLPVQLVDMYLARSKRDTASARLDMGQAKADVTDLVMCMQDEAYKHAIIPLAVDARTGGGVYLMGQEQLRRQCHNGDAYGEFPPWSCSLALVDYHLGNPLNDAGAGSFMGNAVHECRILSPKDMGRIGKPALAYVSIALDESQKVYEERSKRESKQSFWSSYTTNPSLAGSMPNQCPPRFQPYFGAYEEPRSSQDDLINWESDMREAKGARETVVPKCLMLYLDAERLAGIRLDGWYNEKALADGKASITYAEADVAMRDLRYDYGIVDFVPCVARVWYTEDKWKTIAAALFKTPGFRIHYLEYVAGCGFRYDAYEAPLTWMERKEVPYDISRSVGEKARDLKQRLLGL